MSRAAEIAALRALGFSLTQVAVLAGDPQGLEAALASHQATLEGRRTRHLGDTVETVRGLRDDLARGRAPTAVDLARPLAPAAELSVAFDIPLPWGGERFELRDIRSLN